MSIFESLALFFMLSARSRQAVPPGFPPQNESQPGTAPMKNRATDVVLSPFTTALKQLSPRAQLTFLIALFVLGVIAVGLGIYSTPQSSYDASDPPMVVQTAPQVA